MDVSTLPCEIKWRPLQPLLLLINAFLNDCQRLEDGPYGRLVWWEALRLAWSPETCVAAAQCSCARVWCSSLSDIWQQLFEQQYITVIRTVRFHPWLHENHTSAPAPGDTDWNRHAGTWSYSKDPEGQMQPWCETLFLLGEGHRQMESAATGRYRR